KCNISNFFTKNVAKTETGDFAKIGG
ncbi:XRE family transcriptional regulator, partial [Listeria monocytogenes]|nr:XRE family transcriptional regulator [Listeria monocytogenes]